MQNLTTLDLVLLVLAAAAFLVAMFETRIIRRDGGAGINLVACGLLLVVLSLLL